MLDHFSFARDARALFAAGIRAGDIVHNCFSYHLTPGAFILEAGAHALGCATIPGGVGNTEAQLDAIAQLKPSAYVGTPDFLKILLDAVGSASVGREILDILKTGGCHVAWYNPLRIMHLRRINNRTHRKSLVIDGRIGFTGGARAAFTTIVEAFAKGADKDPPDPESQAALDKFEADLASCNTTG